MVNLEIANYTAYVVGSLLFTRSESSDVAISRSAYWAYGGGVFSMRYTPSRFVFLRKGVFGILPLTHLPNLQESPVAILCSCGSWGDG